MPPKVVLVYIPWKRLSPNGFHGMAYRQILTIVCVSCYHLALCVAH